MNIATTPGWRLAWAAALALMASASLADQPYSRKAESSFTETPGPGDALTRTIVNSNFAFDSVYSPATQNFQTVLIAQKVRSVYLPGVEGADAHIEVTAWVSDKGNYDRKLWTIKARANEGGKWSDFYRTVSYGCCDTVDAYDAYDFRTGKHAFTYTTEPVVVDVPNTPTKRYLSYLSYNAASGYTHEKKYPHGIGVLTLAAADRIVDQLLFESGNEELHWSARLALTDGKEPKGTMHLSLWGSNHNSSPEAVGGFAVRVTFADDSAASVPVSHDRFDLQKTVLPPSITARRLPLPAQDQAH